LLALNERDSATHFAIYQKFVRAKGGRELPNPWSNQLNVSLSRFI